MLDQANTEFVNTVITVIRYGVYAALALVALAGAAFLMTLTVGWLSKLLGLLKSSDNGAEKAKQRMKDLGY